MRVISDDLWFCTDCTMAAVNDDYTGLDYSHGPAEADARMKAIQAGLEGLGGHAVAGDGENEFSWRPCECCGSSLGGRRVEFAVLGSEA